MANQYYKLDPIDDDPLSVHGGEGGEVRPKQKWPVTTTTLSGLNNKDLAKELWEAVNKGQKGSGGRRLKLCVCCKYGYGSFNKSFYR